MRLDLEWYDGRRVVGEILLLSGDVHDVWRRGDLSALYFQLDITIYNSQCLCASYADLRGLVLAEARVCLCCGCVAR